MDLKICENLDREICDHFGIQLTAKKSHLQERKFQQYTIGYKLDNESSIVPEATLEFHNEMEEPKNFQILLGNS